MPVEKFAVIGHPLGHTMSPFIHKALFDITGRAAEYCALDISPETLKENYAELKRLRGYNITIPHKQAIIPLLCGLDESAADYGAVNCVSNGECSTGYNTDAYGFLSALKLAGIPLSGKVVIYGCGGAARTIALECLKAGCALTLAVREHSLDSAKLLERELLTKFPDCEINIKLIGSFTEKCDLLINATPVGMYPNTDASPADEAQLKVTGGVFDAVYNPRKTKLVKTAEKLGTPHAEGMAMLVCQAAKAHEIWYGAKFTPEQINRVISAAYDEMERIFSK